MWKRIKENAATVAATATVFVGFAAIAQFGVVSPIQQRFDAIDQRFDDLRVEMNQRFGAVDQRFDDLRGEMNRRFDDQHEYVNQRFDAVDQRFEAVEQRFDAVDQRFEAVDQRFDAVDQRFDSVEERLGRLSGEVSDLRRLTDRVSRNEGRLDAVTQQLQAIGAPAP